MSTAVSPPENVKKARTKAKERYLKRKKERRKQRKSEAAQSKLPSTSVSVHDEDAQSSTHDENETLVVPAAQPQREIPRKRRKIRKELDLQEQEELVQEENDEEFSEAEGGAPQELPLPDQRTPTPPAAFPTFPLPIAPDAPSKSALALQGLDKALLGAEIINPSTNISIEELGSDRSPDKGDLPVLGQKMTKRLRELGISEFFASKSSIRSHAYITTYTNHKVQTALLPFLLPSKHHRRALYLPYDPPQDVCASAPTGSGKTLTYVVPIVEVSL